jgi:hypothetical protein
MRSSHVKAIWLFERLGLDGALAGDLLEESASGRSTIWYWRQILAAIWIGIWGAIFGHKVLALRAVATGCAANATWLFVLKFLHPWAPPFPMMFDPSNHPLLTTLLTQFATGWIVARTHRPYAIPMVVVFVMWLALWYVGGTLSGNESRFLAHLARYISTVDVGLLVGGIVGAHPNGQLILADKSGAGLNT